MFQKKDMGCKTASNVQTIEEDKMVNCSRENRRFWKTLTGKEEVGEVAPAGPPEEDEVSAKQNVKSTELSILTIAIPGVRDCDR